VVKTRDFKFESKRLQRAFERARAAEPLYARQLRKLARFIGDIVNGFPPGDPNSVGPITEMLNRYSGLIRPWATVQATRMLEDVGQRDKEIWAALGDRMRRALKTEIEEAPTGVAMRQILAENVDLITSLPIEAAKRVHKLTIEGMLNSTRAREISAEIQRSGEVTRSRANLIARTEVARTASVLTQTRSEYVGSVAYIWRTARDKQVRHSHKLMEGKVVQWDTPPTLEDGTVTHAGQIYNCRCYPEPIVPETFD
jgi:SPP1 gp7 family putative phage head morphogenesis protein